MSIIRKSFDGSSVGISEACSFVRETLNSYKLDKKAITRAVLSLEESAMKLVEISKQDFQMNVAVRKSFFEYSLELSAPGEEITFYDSSLIIKDKNYKADQYTESALRNVLIEAMGDSLRYIHKNGYNKILIKVQKIERSMLFSAVLSMILAIVAGVLLRNFASQEIQQLFSLKLFGPLTTMFMNSLKMLVVPVVFFSIITSVSQFSNFSEFGKVGGKTVGFFVLTTIISAVVGILVFNLLSPGEFGIYKETFTNVNDVAAVGKKMSMEDFSVIDIIVKIIPDNIVKPYADADMLQIIFIAVLLGASIGRIGEYSSSIKHLLDGFNLLFMNATNFIIKAVPIAIFTSIAELVMKTNPNTILQLASFLATFMVALVILTLIYFMIIRVIANLSPIVFCKKFANIIIKAFSLGSSSACIPDSIMGCKSLGISDKVSSFSIPMGATINMNGSCLFFVISSLFLGKLCGLTFAGNDYFIIVFTSLILSVGCPAIPGVGLVCLAVMMMQLGIPAGALALLMGIDPIMCMFRTAFNVTGDAVCSIVVAKQENLLDVEKYYSDKA